MAKSTSSTRMPTSKEQGSKTENITIKERPETQPINRGTEKLCITATNKVSAPEATHTASKVVIWISQSTTSMTPI
jgi:hypothetical protein